MLKPDISILLNRLENIRGLKDAKYELYKELHKYYLNKALEEYKSKYTWYMRYSYPMLVKN